MAPKAWRDRLFRKSAPFIRNIQVLNEDGSFSDDLGILWAAYKQNKQPEIDKEVFAKAVVQRLSAYRWNYLIEDTSKAFKSGRGPVCHVGLMTDGWKAVPAFEVFPWATVANRLRCAVSFLQTLKHSKDVGVGEVRTLNPEFPRKLRKYGVLFYVGRIPNGCPDGDEYLFSIKCKK